LTDLTSSSAIRNNSALSCHVFRRFRDGTLPSEFRFSFFPIAGATAALDVLASLMADGSSTTAQLFVSRERVEEMGVWEIAICVSEAIAEAGTSAASKI
tara:strand:+ start:241 stop:537 length:297 start_codon:yes stop_codon:yes gene_type:complete